MNLQLTVLMNGVYRTLKGETLTDLIYNYRRLMNTLNVPQTPTIVDTWVGSR